MDRSTAAARPDSEINSSIISEPRKVDKSLEIGYISNIPKSPREIGKSRVRLPCYKVVLPLSVGSGVLSDIFTAACNKHKFLLSEHTSSSITAIQTLTSTMRNLFTCIMPLSEEKKARTSSIIKLDIALNEKNCARIVTIKGTYGFPNRIYPVIQLFKELLEKSGAEFLKENKEDNDPALPTFQTAYYQVSRFLSNGEMPAGKLFQSFLEEFWTKYEDINASTSKTREIINYIRVLVDNISEIIIKSVPQYTKIAVEKYIYSKVFQQLKKIFGEKKSSTTLEFLKKREIFRSKTYEELMSQLEIKEKFRIKGNNDPYLSAIESLNNLDKHTSPIDKLNCILESTTHMKTTVIDYWKGREELETMDDQLPVIIFIVCRTSLDSLPAQIEFLIDYTRCNSGMDNENRLLVNYDAAISFIVNEM